MLFLHHSPCKQDTRGHGLHCIYRDGMATVVLNLLNSNLDQGFDKQEQFTLTELFLADPVRIPLLNSRIVHLWLLRAQRAEYRQWVCDLVFRSNLSFFELLLIEVLLVNIPVIHVFSFDARGLFITPA